VPQQNSRNPVDLVFGAVAELRAVAEFHPADDAKVMMLDRF
jgi:catalase (peroxidase I)